MSGMRLHKFLASAGVASRRVSETYIAEGRVTVDGERVREMGIIVDPEKQEVCFDGRRVILQRPVYYVVNKPAGFFCTNEDPWGRPTVLSLVNDPQHRRLHTVGRLDEESEGLILVTNDGEFSNRISHPRYGVERSYEVRVTGSISDETLDRARGGIWVSEEEGKSGPLRIRLQKKTPSHSVLLIKAKGRQGLLLRRVFSRLGHNVQRLIRTGIGPLRIWGIKKGAVRRLSKAEITSLLENSSPVPASKEGGAKPRRKSTEKSVRSVARPKGKPVARTAKPSGGRPPVKRPRSRSAPRTS